MRNVILLAVALFLLAAGAHAAPAPVQQQPAFDIEKATESYLAQVPPDKRAKSDAYFEGGYWLQLWNLLLTVAICVVLLTTRTTARIRDGIERFTARPFLQRFLQAVAFILLLTVLTLPFTIYQDYVREHHYGLSNLTFSAWVGEQLKGLAIGLLLGALMISLLYRIARWAPRKWPVLGALVTIGFMIFGAMLAPVFIAPIFNKYTDLSDPRVREPILGLARQNGIDASHVYVFDASRQTSRVSANVSGLFGTTRISLNDNLLRRCSLEEIEMVMSHEMGHYVLHHVLKMIIFQAIIIVAAFFLLQKSSTLLLSRFGERWQIRDLADPASLPLMTVLITLIFFLLTPVNNTLVRVQEAEADIFGVNASRQPDAFATTALKLGEYRKLAPGPIEEAVFFDHPSGRSRILMAMRWKAEELKRH